MRGLDPHDGLMSDTGRVISVLEGWQADYIGDQYILGPGPQAIPPSQQMGNAD